MGSCSCSRVVVVVELQLRCVIQSCLQTFGNKTPNVYKYSSIGVQMY